LQIAWKTSAHKASLRAIRNCSTWLAVEFQDPTINAKPSDRHRWDIKHVVRLIVNQQHLPAGLEPAEGTEEIDGANRLLASQTPGGSDAEFVRDNALTAAGLIVLDDIGGPERQAYQPGDYYANLQFPNRVYTASPDERQYRRGVYMHLAADVPASDARELRCPQAGKTVSARGNVSNTPQQALTLLNDPEFVEARPRAGAADHGA